MATLIEKIKILRERTGAGMMDCKNALVDSGEDVEKAITLLREKGIVKASKKADRIAAEGLTIVKYCEKCSTGLILEINCETDFVSKSDAFHELVEDSAKAIMKNRENIHCIDCAKKEVEPLFNEAVIKMGEKLDFRRYELVNVEAGQGVGTYIHMGGKISVLTILASVNPELAKGISMTIAANNPQYLSKADVPADIYNKELEVQKELAKTDEKLANKPAEALAKILDGKVTKILSEQILLEQQYVLDPSKTVNQVLVEAKNSVVKFVRYQVGEGLEKRVDNFAEEVMAQVN